jgi:pSer/pThr/pTyr-binding forkhead associated (FHA) protein
LKLANSNHRFSPQNQAELIVGRAYKKHQPDIDLGQYGGVEAGVSRKHGRFVRKLDQWYVEDLGSTNGTFINGSRVPANQLTPVERGDKIRFGQIELEFLLED